MRISTLIQGLSIAVVLLVAGTPAYGASYYINTPGTQLDNDPILDIAGRPGDDVSWGGFLDTTGLTANLQSITLVANLDPNELIGFNSVRTDDNAQFFPEFSGQVSVDPNTGLITLIGVASGPSGVPPNFNFKFNDITATLDSQLNNDGKADFSVDVLSAIDVNGIDVTAQFTGIQQFEVQPVPEPSSIFGLVLAGGFGVFLRKQKRKVQY